MAGRRAVVLAVLLIGAGLARGEDAKPVAGLLLVVNKGDHTLGVVDPASGKSLATVVQSGVTAHEVAVSPDGRYAYLPIYGDSGVGRPGSDGRTLDVVNVGLRRRVAVIDLALPTRPHAAAFGADGRLYVTTELTQSITVIDPRTNTVVDRIPTGQPESHMLVLSRDGRRAWTSNVGPGTVSAIDIKERRVIAIVPVSKTAQRIALSVDEKWLFTADQGEPRLAVIDTSTSRLARWIALPGKGYGAAPTPDGRWLLVALSGAGQVAVVDLQAMTVARTLDVPKAPQEVLVRPDGKAAYVSCDASGKVAEIDLASWKVARLLDAGAMVDGLAWAEAGR